MAKIKIEIDTDTFECNANNEIYESIMRSLQEAIKMNNSIKEGSKKWKPKDGELFHFIGETGLVTTTFWQEDGTYSNRLYKCNNVYETYEEATFEAECRKVIAELETFADENNDEIEWKKYKQMKYYFYYDHYEQKIDIGYCCYQQRQGGVYFSTRDLCRQAIETVGEDRIKKYLFNVED